MAKAVKIKGNSSTLLTHKDYLSVLSEYVYSSDHTIDYPSPAIPRTNNNIFITWGNPPEFHVFAYDPISKTDYYLLQPVSKSQLRSLLNKLGFKKKGTYFTQMSLF